MAQQVDGALTVHGPSWNVPPVNRERSTLSHGANSPGGADGILRWQAAALEPGSVRDWHAAFYGRVGPESLRVAFLERLARCWSGVRAVLPQLMRRVVASKVVAYAWQASRAYLDEDLCRYLRDSSQTGRRSRGLAVVFPSGPD